MAAKGTEAKQAVTKILLSTFKGAFLQDKIIRIPMEENGEVIEIKVSLTAAKDILGNNVASVIEQPTAPVATSTIEALSVWGSTPTDSPKADDCPFDIDDSDAPSQEEMERVKAMLAKL